MGDIGFFLFIINFIYIYIYIFNLYILILNYLKRKGTHAYNLVEYITGLKGIIWCIIIYYYCFWCV
jgi:hypothetical protein